MNNYKPSRYRELWIYESDFGMHSSDSIPPFVFDNGNMEDNKPGTVTSLNPNVSHSNQVITPAGLESLYNACRRIYPTQPNPLQVTAVVKYWLGGPDPLDYVSMYGNEGDANNNIPPHWHYISFGLSDLHGDGRVHLVTGSDTPSGFGFELTFRLKREPEETAPPTWPAAIMQALAKYVFQSENVLYAGDHVSWHCSLDNSESRVQHMLMTVDPQLGTVHTPYGLVNFIQIVGVCAEELQAAQHWNGPGVIELMKNISGAGGPWLITDMRRGETIFELDPQVQEAVDQGIESEGSNLSGVSARCAWVENDTSNLEERKLPDERSTERDCDPCLPRISELESEEIKAILKKGLLHTKPVLPPIQSRNCTELIENNSRKESYDSNASSDTGTLELLRTRTLEAIHITLNLEAGCLLPLALRGRLKHGRHFTFKNVVGDVAITFVTSSVVGAIADQEHPFAAHGPWLQVLLNEGVVSEMMSDLEMLSNPDEMVLPKTFTWLEKKLAITILPDEY